MNIDYTDKYNPCLATTSMNTSSRYKLIQTSKILSSLEHEGWKLDQLSVAKARKYKGFQRHLLRLDHPELPALKDGYKIQAVIINAHTGTSRLYMMLGIWGNLCANGLIVGTGYYCAAIRHSGETIHAQVETANRLLLDESLRLHSNIELMQNRILSDDEKASFAQKACKLRFLDNPPINYIELTKAKRPEDADSTVWKVYNTIQENVIKGGIDGRTASNRRTVTRDIKSIERSTHINRELFNIAQSYIN